jgi:hypothetical protein
MSLRRGAALIAALAGLAPTPSSGDLITYATAPFSASFAGDSFTVDGIAPPAALDLVPAVPQLVLLDSGWQAVSGAQVQTFTGTATSDLTIDGITRPFSDAFGFTTGPSAGISWSGGAPVVFDLGAFRVTVTPVASDGFRAADFLEAPAAAPVPEPSSALLAGLGALAGLAVWARKRRAARARAAGPDRPGGVAEGPAARP